MAPEVLERGVVSKAADVYSFGVLLWQVRHASWSASISAEVTELATQLRRLTMFDRRLLPSLFLGLAP
jgi:hypothetical protein